MNDIFFRLAIVTVLCTSAGLAQTQAPKTDSRSDLIRRRMEWFYGQRAFPLKRIPAGARLRAIQQMDRMLPGTTTGDVDFSSDNGFDVSSVATSSTRWTLIGPEPTLTPFDDPRTSGRITALAVDPTNANVAYAGAAGGGVWKTTDGGVHWTPLTDKQPSLAVGSIAIDPSNHSTVYVGTGEENFSSDSYYGAGILKSTNGGVSWTQIKGPFVRPLGSDSGGAHIGAIAVDPGNSSVILAAVRNYPITTGIYRSEDGGATWQNVLSRNDGTAVLFDPGNGNIAYAALNYDHVYKSLDAGKTWGRLDGTGANVLPANLGRVSLAIAPSSPQTIYAGIQDPSSSNTLGIFKTTDGGTNWVKLINAPPFCGFQCWYDQAIAVQPNNANVVFAGGNASVYRTTDGGSHWTDVTSGADGLSLHEDLHALAFAADSSVLYAGNDGGVWSASSPTATPVPWNELNDTLAITQFYFPASINPTDVTQSFGGTQDNGTERYSGALTWDRVTCGDGGWTVIDPITPTIVYSSCWIQNGVVRKSTAGGIYGTWATPVNGINLSDPMAFLPPIAIDPLRPANLYFGTYRVYQTRTKASSWVPISGDLSGGGALTAIVVAPTDSNTVYAGNSNGQIYTTINALAGTSATWNNRSTGLPLRYLTHVLVDPHTSSTAYATFSGFSGFADVLGHVFRTIDSGVTWKDVSGNLPNVPVNAIAIDPVLANTYYVATDIGVFRTRNVGVTWSVLGSGLPRVTVLGVTLHNQSRTLRAATHGRSMWDIHVPIADLATVVTASPSPVTHGTNLKYTLTVTNKGPDIAANTLVSDVTPVGTTFVGFTTSAGTCTAPTLGAAGTLSCKVGTLASGAKVTVTMTVKDTAVAGSTLTDTGKASTTTPDPNIKNNSMTVKTGVS